MKEGPSIASVAALIGDPARANMLAALMSGRALTAGELAREAGIAAPTASGHLARLREAGLVLVEAQGRHRYVRLAGPEVAVVLEGLMGLSARDGRLRTRPGPRDPALRTARVCYDHLAGEWGVRLYDALLADGRLDAAGGSPVLTPRGRAFFAAEGIDLAAPASSRRPLCRACLDWSERRPHLAGALGRAILDHALARHDPEAAQAENPYRALLEGVVRRQAELVARWLHVGFIHGVMNTDNMSIAGETIDYGPCAFLDSYDPATAFSSIDRHGRYAYGNQPRIALWNLTRLAEALLPLLAQDESAAVAEAETALAGFAGLFEAAYFGGLRRKLGLTTAREDDPELASDLLKAMAENGADFTLTFRRLCDAVPGSGGGPAAVEAVRSLFIDPTAYDRWAERWHRRLVEEPEEADGRSRAMRAVNPAFIPRNHRVEEMIEAAVEREDFAPFETLLSVLSRPYADQPDYARYAEAPEGGGRDYRTFCGT